VRQPVEELREKDAGHLSQTTKPDRIPQYKSVRKPGQRKTVLQKSPLEIHVVQEASAIHHIDEGSFRRLFLEERDPHVFEANPPKKEMPQHPNDQTGASHHRRWMKRRRRRSGSHCWRLLGLASTHASQVAENKGN
jgi:hypothetical protein